MGEGLTYGMNGWCKEIPGGDLISRAEAIDATWFEPSYTDPLNVLTEVRDRLKVLPSAQPEIIRCRECVYKPCKMMPYSYDDDFCSYAERKTDGI